MFNSYYLFFLIVSSPFLKFNSIPFIFWAESALYVYPSPYISEDLPDIYLSIYIFK
jgi:hypothetical protein